LGRLGPEPGGQSANGVVERESGSKLGNTRLCSMPACACPKARPADGGAIHAPPARETWKSMQQAPAAAHMCTRMAVRSQRPFPSGARRLPGAAAGKRASGRPCTTLPAASHLRPARHRPAAAGPRSPGCCAAARGAWFSSRRATAASSAAAGGGPPARSPRAGGGIRLSLPPLARGLALQPASSSLRWGRNLRMRRARGPGRRPRDIRHMTCNVMKGAHTRYGGSEASVPKEQACTVRGPHQRRVEMVCG
jgi:hypothetical protein